MNLPEADRNVMRPVQWAALVLQNLKGLWVATDCTLKGMSFNSVCVYERTFDKGKGKVHPRTGHEGTERD
jgi:hypothetical protein